MFNTLTDIVVTIILGIGILALIGVVFFVFFDRMVQKNNLVMGNFPFLGRFRYVAHTLRPFFRQYFGDDNAFAERIIIDWILNVSEGRTGYFAFDKFDTTLKLHDGKHQMIHSCLLYTSPSPRDLSTSRMPSSA